MTRLRSLFAGWPWNWRDWLCCGVLALGMAGGMKAGTITLTPANVAAILSGISSGIDIIKDGKDSGPILGARKVKAVVLHPFHMKAALRKVTKATK